MIKKYDKYQNTEFEWLGVIPENWQVVRVKDYTYLKARIGWQGLRSDEFIENTNWYCVTGTDFSNGTIDWANCYCVEQDRFDQDTKIQLKPNDLLITKDGTIGKIALINDLPKQATLNSGVFVTRPLKNKYSNQYMFWLLSSNVFTKFIDYNKNGSTILHLYQNVFERFFYCLPGDTEQNAIALYLDSKTKAIDKKVNLLTKKADYYKELRKSIINDAVCKGLGKNVNLKVSEFAFSVNVNWKQYRLKDLGFLYSGLSGKAGDDFNQEDNPNNKGFIPFTNIANNTYLKANHLGSVVVYENEKQNKVRKGDLFFLMSSEGYDDVGKTAALAEDIPDTYLNSFCKGYRITKKNCEPYFLNYLLLSDNYRKSLITEGKGFTRINLKMEKVTDFFVYLPPTNEEQIAIANYLDEKTQKIDAIVTNIGKQIETLKELRKTLINDVVTGKIKVTNN
jgi:type I restriction enzyme S subunit